MSGGWRDVCGKYDGLDGAGAVNDIDALLVGKIDSADILGRYVARLPTPEQFFKLWFDLVHRGVADDDHGRIVRFEPGLVVIDE